MPASSAAIATNGFIVDPGGYWLEIDLLISGLYLSLFNFSHFEFEIVAENKLGSYEGDVTNAGTLQLTH